MEHTSNEKNSKTISNSTEKNGFPGYCSRVVVFFSIYLGFLVAQVVKRLFAMLAALGQEDPLEKEMATHSSTFAWKIP